MLQDVWKTAFLFDAAGAGGGGDGSSDGAGKGDEDAGTSEKGKDPDVVPKGWEDHPRWQKFHGYHKDMTEVIGDLTPAELAAERRELLEYRAILAEEKVPEKTEPDTPDEKKRADLIERAKKDLAEVAPGLYETITMEANRFKALSRRADRETTKIMREYDYDPNDREERKWLSKTIVEIINSSEEIWDEYYTGSPNSAVRMAFEKLQTKLKLKTDRSDRADKLRKGKELTKRLPKRLPAGGTEVTKEEDDSPKKVKGSYLKGAEENILKKLEAAGE